MPVKKRSEKEKLIIDKLISDSINVFELNEKLSGELVYNRKVITKLSEDVAKLKSWFDTSVDTSEIESQQTQDIRKELSRLKLENAKYQNQLKIKDAELDKLLFYKKIISEKSDDKSFKGIDKNKRLMILQQEIVDINDLFKIQTKRKDQLEKDNTVLKQELEHLRSLSDEMEDKKDLIKKLEGEIFVLHKGLMDSDSSSKEFLKAIDSLKLDIEASRKLLNDKNELLIKKDRKIELLEEHIQAKNKIMELNGHQVNALESSMVELENNIKDKYDDKAKTFEILIIDRDKEIEKLKNDLETAEEAFNEKIKDLQQDYSKIIEEKEGHIDKHKGTAEEMQKQIEELKEVINRKSELINTMSINLKKKDELLSSIEKNSQNYISTIEAKDKQLELHNQRRQSHSKKVQSLNASIITLKEDLTAVERINKELMLKVKTDTDIITSLTEKLKERDKELSMKDSYYPMLFEVEKMDVRNEIENLVKEKAQKEVHFNLEIQKLNEVIMGQEKLIQQIQKKYVWFADQFKKEFTDVLKDVSEKVIYDENLIEEAEEAEAEDVSSGNVKEYQTIQHTKSKGALPVSIEEIMPMLDIALQHGDSIDQIKESLIAANYDERDIEIAIKKVKKG